LTLLVIDRITASSSASPASSGNKSVITIPLCPRGLVSHGLAMMLPLLLNIVGFTGTGIGWPWRRFSSGLGSKESTCDTPPLM
jgi:hypothetical protein